MINILFQKYIIAFILTVCFYQNFKPIDINFIRTKVEEGDYIIKGNNYYLKCNIIEKFNKYIKSCKKGKIIDKTKYPLLKAPKISVIIPLYNGGKYLYYSLRSIQNQKMKDLEIIIIDDCSSDDSLNYVKKFMEEDSRIRLIKNKRNRKILYSKSIAALNSNGEFILELDQDDMFIREDLFDIIYKESKKYNLDLVQFRDIIKDIWFFQRRTRINFSNLHWIFPKQTFYMEESELKATLFKNRNNYLIWGLLINSNTYKKAVYNLWEFILNYQLIYNEDYISTTMILTLAHNYKYLNIIGLFHIKHEKAASYKCSEKTEFHLSNILFPIYLNDFFVKTKQENVYLVFNYLNQFKSFQRKASYVYPKFFDFNIRNLFYNNYLLPNNKQIILDIFNININKSIILSSYAYFMNLSDYNSIFNFQKKIINNFSKNKQDIHNLINHKTNMSNTFQYIYVNDSQFIIDINKINKKKFKKNKRHVKRMLIPKISIIIYCNEIKFLEPTLISIIEQKNFYSNEIIIIYDSFNKINLSDNFKYNNIHILNNQKKRGIMYSFIIGTLSSKGKYILHFQSGYTLTKEDILLYLFRTAEDNQIDVLEFNLLINKDYYINENSFSLYRCHHFNSSLNTSIIKYNKNFKEIDQEKELLINKLIKASIYRHIIHKYKLFTFENIIYNNYDDILMFLINKNRYIFKHIDVFGIIKNINHTNSLNLNHILNSPEQKISDSVFYINFLFEHSENDFNDKKYVLEEYLNKLSLIHNKSMPKSNSSINLFTKFIKCQFINDIDKQELSFFYNSLIS